MQTFLPYKSFKLSARSLDRMRLGKQRVETFQLLRALSRDSKGWRNHPAARMWRGHEHYLVDYGIAVCDEWTSRGYKDSMKVQILAHSLLFKPAGPPGWLGLEAMHSSHRAALLHKLPEHYGTLGWSEEPRLAYHWPA